MSTTSTVARPISIESAHFYTGEGEPLYSVQKKDGSGPRPFTLADARKMNPLPYPSVTTVQQIIYKPGLELWKQEQLVLTVATTPRLEGELIDNFVYRIVHTERQHELEAKKAAGLGIDIHDAAEALGKGDRITDEIRPYIEPAWNAVVDPRAVWECEKVLVGNGYAGRADLIQETPEEIIITDWKSTKTLPKSSYPEHVIQCAALADALRLQHENNLDFRPIRTRNVYISTVDCGKFIVCDHNPDWIAAFLAFTHILQIWKYLNAYDL